MTIAMLMRNTLLAAKLQGYEMGGQEPEVLADPASAQFAASQGRA
jgi:hypothetical protein